MIETKNNILYLSSYTDLYIEKLKFTVLKTFFNFFYKLLLFDIAISNLQIQNTTNIVCANFDNYD